MVTIKSIAESLGLSSATVSRALRDDDTLSITAETRARILMTAEAMGYSKKSRTNNPESNKKILIIHKLSTFRNQIDSSYYFSMRTGIEDFLRQRQLDYNYHDIEHLSDYREKPCGLIIMGNYSEQQYDQLYSKFRSIPMTAIGTTAYHTDVIDHVTYSNQESVAMAIRYLWQNHHSRIGYLGIEEVEGTKIFGSRKQIFIDLMRSENQLHNEWIYECGHGDDRVEQGCTTMKKWLGKKEPLPTALFCANDPAALGAMKALQEAGLRIPQDISVISHDGSYPTQFTYPELTTVDVHPYQLGWEGASLLLERLQNGRKITKRLMLIPKLMIRGSVSPCSIP